MSRFLERRWTIDLAATLLVVLVAVSIGDIDDYDMHVAALRCPVYASVTPNPTIEISSANCDSGPGPDHVCSCLLCIMTLTDSFGPRILPPTAGKLSASIAGGTADSPHLSQVFHPPSA